MTLAPYVIERCMTLKRETLPAGLLSAGQVASQLGLSVRAIYVLVGRGELTGYKLGRRLRFDSVDIERFLDTRRINEAAR